MKIKVGPDHRPVQGQGRVPRARRRRPHVAVLRAEGRDTAGQGNANATITAALVADGDGTAVSIITDLTVTGQVAQFGRGVLADVSAKLLDQFVESLESTVLADEPEAAVEVSADRGSTCRCEVEAAPEAPAATAPAPDAPAIRRIDSPEPQPVDLLDAAGSSVGKRVGPVLAVVAVLWLLKKLLSRRKK